MRKKIVFGHCPYCEEEITSGQIVLKFANELYHKECVYEMDADEILELAGVGTTPSEVLKHLGVTPALAEEV